MHFRRVPYVSLENVLVLINLLLVIEYAAGEQVGDLRICTQNYQPLESYKTE